MTWQPTHFEEAAREGIFNGSTRSGVNIACKDIGANLNRLMYDAAPDKMSDDGESLSFGGVDFVLDRVLKSGGNGRATRYKDPQTGRTIVVKTALSKSAGEALAAEMWNHRRLMNSIDPDEAETSGIVAMQGVARSPDGSVHMIMEDVQGGDLEDVANTMAVMSGAGLLPGAARQVLMCDLITKTARAMKEMEAAGLVHGDMKGENVMLTSGGRIKIIDFGEAGFVEEDGIGTNAGGGTPGYRAPELGGREARFDARADTYALGGMLQKLVLTDIPSDDRSYTEGSMGKLIASLKDPDPQNRPTLDAVMFNTLLASGAQDYDQAEIEDLKDAVAEVSTMIAGARTTITTDEIAENLPRNGGTLEAGEISLRKLQDSTSHIQSMIARLQSEAQGDEVAYLTRVKPEIAAQEKELEFLRQVIKSAVEAKTAEAEQAFAAAVADPQVMVHLVLPGQTSDVALPRVHALRKQMADKLDEARHLFEQALMPPEDPNLEEAETQSARIQKGEANLRLIDDAIYAAVGPEAKFFLSQEKLRLAAKAFAH